MSLTEHVTPRSHLDCRFEFCCLPGGPLSIAETRRAASPPIRNLSNDAPRSLAGLREEMTLVGERTRIAGSVVAAASNRCVKSGAPCGRGWAPGPQASKCRSADPSASRSAHSLGAAIYAFALEQLKQAGMRVAVKATGADPGSASARRACRKVGFSAVIPSVEMCRKL